MEIFLSRRCGSRTSKETCVTPTRGEGWNSGSIPCWSRNDGCSWQQRECAGLDSMDSAHAGCDGRDLSNSHCLGGISPFCPDRPDLPSGATGSRGLFLSSPLPLLLRPVESCSRLHPAPVQGYPRVSPVILQ